MTRIAVLTGASGYIAKHVAVELLNAGYQLRATLRDPARGDEVRTALLPHLADRDDLRDRLQFAELDLTRDAGWDKVLAGAQALVHTASPFPLASPKDAELLIRPAVDGTLRALRAAKDAGVAQVVLTSSVAAIAYGRGVDRSRPLTEADWTDPDDPTISTYVRSKTLAERAAWAFQREDAPQMTLSTINPALVVGPPLDRSFGASVSVVARLLRGKDPMLPRLGFGVVDVRDVALMHLRALERPEAVGQRFIAAAQSLWFHEMARILAEAFPERRIPRRVAPDLLIRLLALFDPAIRSIVPELGLMPHFSNARAQTDLGIAFRPVELALAETARVLIEAGAVD